MHPLEVKAFRHDLRRSDLEAAISAWDIFAETKGLLGTLYVGSTLAVCGRLSVAEYRRLVEDVSLGISCILDRVREISFHSDDERAAFGDALLSFRQELRAHVLSSAAEAHDLAAAAAHAYVAGRTLGRRFWVLEMRPEGLPLTPLALQQYAPLLEGAR